MQSKKGMEKIWNMIADYQQMTPEALLKSISRHLEFSVCKTRYSAKDVHIYESLALSIRDRLVEFWNDTHRTYHSSDCKRVYYLSLEYLMGRSLRNNLMNLDILETCKSVLDDISCDLEEIEELEHDAGLGNGGLGRLAACFLDSMASLQLPAYGYGIRYDYGIFKQKIENSAQVEDPDDWLSDGYPWEIPNHDYNVPIQFYGHVFEYDDEKGVRRFVWQDTQDVIAMAFDVPIAGYQNHTVNNLRLWKASPAKDFDFHLFNEGDYMRSVEEKQKSETISRVLYPNDKSFSGRELRLKQQFFFVSASLQDIIRRYKRTRQTFDEFPNKVAIQLNDTHPSIAIPELMRLLIDIEELDWDTAWDITVKVFAYTNHTVLPEALERWPVSMLGNLLPRHLQIIYAINDRFLKDVETLYPGDMERMRRMSLIEEGGSKEVRMPYLAIVGSHAINGVAALHTKLLQATIFKDFYEMYPNRFQNKTNGITHRRWLKACNPELSDLITQKIGKEWIHDLSQLEKLENFAEDASFRKAWRDVKHQKKVQFAKWLKESQGVEINPNSMFDVQIKRIHEYKRQLLNILHIITLYNRIRENPNQSFVPRTIILGGKAAPGYYMAKLIIQLANDVAKVVNRHPEVGDRLKVVFLENYRVSSAEKIIPATEISEHISTAGTEASGTSNMKFSLNGSLIIGTMDGATVEICEEVGEENIFIFGLNSDEVAEAKDKGYNPRVHYQSNLELREALEMINTGYFNREEPQLYNDIYNSLVYDDTYLLLADYESYVACQERVSTIYQDQEQWTRMSIHNTANMGKFSSDRTINEYAEDIWGVKPIEIRPYDHKVR